MEEPKRKRQKKPVGLGIERFLCETGPGRSLVESGKNNIVFAQGDAADSIYYIHSGKIKLSVVSNEGKEAVIALLGPNDFFGEGCLTTQVVRMASAVSMTSGSLLRIDKNTAVELVREDPAFADLLLAYILSRTIRIEEDLIDHMFNSSEKRLARALLLLANFGKAGTPEIVIPKISQETLALMIGTTRPRVSFFMNKFRKLGFIKYNGTLEVHSSLLNVILHD